MVLNLFYLTGVRTMQGDPKGLCSPSPKYLAATSCKFLQTHIWPPSQTFSYTYEPVLHMVLYTLYTLQGILVLEKWVYLIATCVCLYRPINLALALPPAYIEHQLLGFLCDTHVEILSILEVMVIHQQHLFPWVVLGGGGRE